MAKLLWGVVSLTFRIRKPDCVEHLFGPWLRSFSNKQRNLVLIGVAAFCWAIWISRNDIVFHKSHFISILQVMYRGGPLDQELGRPLKGKREEHFEGRLSTSGECGVGDLP
jgi:hypothetical protein